MHDKPDDYLGTPSEVAPYIHHDDRSLARWRAEGRGPCYIKAGRRILYRKRDLDAWLNERRVTPVRESGAA